MRRVTAPACFKAMAQRQCGAVASRRSRRMSPSLSPPPLRTVGLDGDIVLGGPARLKIYAVLYNICDFRPRWPDGILRAAAAEIRGLSRTPGFEQGRPVTGALN